MGRKISDNKGQFTGKMPTGAENQLIADSTLFADGRQAITTVAISSSLTSKKPAELEEDATEEWISAHQDQGISDSVDMGGDEPLLLAQADIARVSGSGTGAAAAQSSSAYSAGPPPWLWVAGGLGAAVAGGAIIVASSGSDSDAVTPPPVPVNAVPVFTSGTTGSVVENATVSTVIYDAAASDPEGETVTLSLGGADAALLGINAVTGEVTLKAPADYETKANYSFTVIASDGIKAAEQPVTVTVVNINEHVVVEQDGVWIDVNANGIKDVADTTPADFNSNISFADRPVTVHFNDMPTIPVDLTGFGLNDKIEIDINAIVGNMGLEEVRSFVNYSGSPTVGGPQNYLWLQADNSYFFSMWFRSTSVYTTGGFPVATGAVLGFPYIGLAYWTDTATNPLGDVRNILPGVATSNGHVVSGATSAYQELNLGSGNGFLVDFLWPQTTYVVVDNHGVEPAALWIDANANGVLDSDETTLALLGQDQADVDAFNAVAGSTYDSQPVDLSSGTVIIHYNDLPGTGWAPSLAGFDANDRIEIDVNAMRFDVDSTLRGSQSRVSITASLPTSSGFGLLGYSNSPPDAVFERTYDSALFFGHFGTTQIGSPSFTTTVNAFVITAPSEGTIATNGSPFPYYTQVDFVVPAV